MDLSDGSRNATRGINISQGRILPAGHKDLKFLFCGGDHPAVPGIDLVKLLEPAFFENLEKEFVRETALFFLRCGDPFVDDRFLDSANRFLFRDAGIGHSIQMATEKLFFLLRTYLAL